MDQVAAISSCLDLFCRGSSLRVSLAKIQVFFSKNVHWNVRILISEALGFRRTNDIGKYLGVP
jgi:hypothetical protein